MTTDLQYGPQTQRVETLLKRVAGLTPKDGGRFEAGDRRRALREIAWLTALQHDRWSARYAWRDAGQLVQAMLAKSTWKLGADTGAHLKWAAQDAAMAVALHDLVGQGNFTYGVYDEWTLPWRETMGNKWTH